MSNLRRLLFAPFLLLVRMHTPLARRKIGAQLVYSHVLVVILTVIVIEVVVAAVLLGFLRWGVLNVDQPNWSLGDDSRVVAAALSGSDAPRSSSLELNEEQRFRIESRLIALTGAPADNTFPGAITQIEEALVTDAQGVVIASSDPGWAERGESVGSIDYPLARDTTARAVELRGAPTIFDRVWLLDWDAERTVASHPIFTTEGEFAGVVTIQSPTFSRLASLLDGDAIFGLLTANIVLLGIITVPAFLAALPVGIWTARAFTKRLTVLSEAADAMSQGDLSRRVNVRGDDEISRLSERFNEMADRLADVDSSRRSFVANVSHELRTPIAIIGGHVDALVQADGDNRSLAVIQQEAKTLERLVDDLFTLTRIEEAALPFDLQRVSVYDVVAESVEGLKTVAWEQRKVTVQSLVSPGVAPVLADRTRLRQILGNLLYNALRHTTEGGLVIVNAASCADAVEVSVTDTGIGISQDDLTRVFDRFYQTERTGRNSQGSGLGLAIVKQLVEAQGGAIGVTSVPGEGTTFRFRLPRARSSSSA